MEDVRKRLAVSIIKFLRSELESERLGEEGGEALEVAVQCLETAYATEGTTMEDDLLELYKLHAPPPHASTPVSNAEVSEEDKTSAESKKVEGNDLMREGRYQEAIAAYSSAILLHPGNAVYYSNRAAAYAKLNDNHNSILDCEKALSIDPSYSKAYGRMGLAYYNEEKYRESMEAYENALKLDPANQPYRTQLQSAKEKLNGGGAQQQQQQQPPNPLAGMDLGSLLSNPAVMNMAQSFMSNPQVQNMFTNMMGSAGGPPGGGPEEAQGGPPPPPQETPGAAPQPGGGAGGLGGLGGMGGIDFNTVLNATSQFAAQMQQQNPEMVENLRQQFQGGADSGAPPPNDEKKAD